MQEHASIDILDAHRQAVSTPIPELVDSLQRHLSRRVTAYLAG